MIKIKINKDMENRFISNMIKNNNIKTIIPFIIKDDDIIIDENNLVTLKDKLSCLIDSKTLLIWLDKLFLSVEIINKYMIDENYIYYDLDKIFIKNDNIYLLVNPYMQNSKNIKDLFFEILMDYKIDEDDFDIRLIKIKNELVNSNYNLITLRKIINDNIKYNENKKKKIISKNKKENVNNLEILKNKFAYNNDRIVKEHDLDNVFKFPKNHKKTFDKS